MKLDNFIRVYDNVFDAHVCKQMILLFNQHHNQHEIHDTDTYKFQQLNFSEHPRLQMIGQRFAAALVPLFEDYFKTLQLDDFVGVQGFEQVRIKKYTTGDEFKTHVDVTDRSTSVRYLVAILYLNDNNGATVFPNIGLSVIPKIGRVVLFPPLWMFPHAGVSPTDTDKYIMMTSLHYI